MRAALVAAHGAHGLGGGGDGAIPLDPPVAPRDGGAGVEHAADGAGAGEEPPGELLWRMLMADEARHVPLDLDD